MAQRLAGGNIAVALIANTAATGAILFVLITLLGPISGAHFNPAVTLTLGTRGSWVPFIAAQIVGGIVGVLIAHAMFDLPLLEQGTTVRTGIDQWISEFVATFGLLLTIILGSRHRAEAVPALVALWIVAGYWFTASTSFANPAITLARADRQLRRDPADRRAGLHRRADARCLGRGPLCKVASPPRRASLKPRHDRHHT